MVGKQVYSWTLNSDTFSRDIAPARTFGFLKDVQKLQEMGLARGGSLSNVVVFDDQRLLNREGFRYANECVRHKILDFVGDLALAGVPLLGYFEVHKAGHALHSTFLRKIMTAPGLCAPVKPGRQRKLYFPPAVFPNFPRPYQQAVERA
jgi:UDP-3-O-[3-hydroxymyristoyl] N-acetylglucosamine deacetylase